MRVMNPSRTGQNREMQTKTNMPTMVANGLIANGSSTRGGNGQNTEARKN